MAGDRERERAGPTRREFLGYGVAGGALLLAGPAGCGQGDAGAPGEDLRDPAPVPAVPAFELEEVSIAELGEGLVSGRWTSRRLAELYLERIDATNRRGPDLRAVIETDPGVLAAADALDAERSSGRVRGPLHGIPILLKDNIGTADGTTTTAGSLALEGSVPARDAFVAARLRAAGAVLLGKAT